MFSYENIFTSCLQAVCKTLLGQVTVFPAYLALFFTYSKVLEGGTLESGFRHTRSAFVPTYKAGWVFWPAVNVFNFMCIAQSQRVLYVNVIGLIWNAFMSYQHTHA